MRQVCRAFQVLRVVSRPFGAHRERLQGGSRCHMLDKAAAVRRLHGGLVAAMVAPPLTCCSGTLMGVHDEAAGVAVTPKQGPTAEAGAARLRMPAYVRGGTATRCRDGSGAGPAVARLGPKSVPEAGAAASLAGDPRLRAPEVVAAGGRLADPVAVPVMRIGARRNAGGGADTVGRSWSRDNTASKVDGPADVPANAPLAAMCSDVPFAAAVGGGDRAGGGVRAKGRETSRCPSAGVPSSAEPSLSSSVTSASFAPQKKLREGACRARRGQGCEGRLQWSASLVGAVLPSHAGRGAHPAGSLAMQCHCNQSNA